MPPVTHDSSTSNSVIASSPTLVSPTPRRTYAKATASPVYAASPSPASNKRHRSPDDTLDNGIAHSRSRLSSPAREASQNADFNVSHNFPELATTSHQMEEDDPPMIPTDGSNTPVASVAPSRTGSPGKSAETAFFDTFVQKITGQATDKKHEFHNGGGYLAAANLFNSICDTLHVDILNEITIRNPRMSEMRESIRHGMEALINTVNHAEDHLNFGNAPLPQPPHNQAALVDAISKLTRTVDTLVTRVNDIEGGKTAERRDAPAADNPFSIPPNGFGSGASIHNPGNKPTPATSSPQRGSKTTKASPQQPQGKNTNAKPTRTPKTQVLAKTEETRFVIHVAKNETGALAKAKLTDCAISARVNDYLKSVGPGGWPVMRVIGAKWNRNDNIILTLQSGINGAYFKSFASGIAKSLNLSEDTLISQDVPWSKVLLTHVPTGSDSQLGVFPDVDVIESFKWSNAWAKDIVFTQNPRWLIKPSLLHKTMSSVVMAFEDHDGTICRELLRKHIYMFGALVKSKRWEDKPVLQECEKCLTLNHATSACKSKSQKCSICAKAHSTENHRLSCILCKKDLTADGTQCPHPPKCANCGYSHMSSDPLCPKRAGYRKAPMPHFHPSDESSNMDTTVA